MVACLVKGLSKAPLRLSHISEIVIDRFKSLFDRILKLCHFHADSMMVGVSCRETEASAAIIIKGWGLEAKSSYLQQSAP
jgi:hypothetical protein